MSEALTDLLKSVEEYIDSATSTTSTATSTATSTDSTTSTNVITVHKKKRKSTITDKSIASRIVRISNLTPEQKKMRGIAIGKKTRNRKDPEEVRLKKREVLRNFAIQHGGKNFALSYCDPYSRRRLFRKTYCYRNMTDEQFEEAMKKLDERYKEKDAARLQDLKDKGVIPADAKSIKECLDKEGVSTVRELRIKKNEEARLERERLYEEYVKKRDEERKRKEEEKRAEREKKRLASKSDKTDNS